MTEDHAPLHPVDGYFTDVFTASKKPPMFIIDNVLPAGLVFLAGPPKEAYKSTLTMGLAARIAGFPVSGLPVEWETRVHGPVMVFSYEADAGELRSCLEEGLGVKGEKNESILICDDPGAYRLDDEEAVEQMLFWMEERGPALVILDPLANFHSIEEKDAGGMIRILSPLRKWAKKHDACMLVVHHTRKIEDGRGYKAQDMRGTSALFGLCDGILMITPAKGQYAVQIDATFKRAPAWNKTFQLGIWDRLGSVGGEALREVDRMVLKAIEHGYTTVEDVARHLAINETNVIARLAFLQKRGLAGRKAGKLVAVAAP